MRRVAGCRLPVASCVVALLVTCAPASGNRQLATGNSFRVCADPANLPFSSADGAGFENKIAELVARDFGERLEYTWLPQRMGFVRNTLGRGACDVIIGVPSNYELASPTVPYYRSSYVFVSRKAGIESLDDPKLKTMKIGVQIAAGSTPAVNALVSRHLVDNMRGYPVTDGGAKKIVDGVAKGDIDLAIVWGPQAGYYAKGLEVTPVSPQIDPPFLPFVFDISMGVRRSNAKLRDRLDAEIEHRRPEIERILDAYGVPRV
jgi:mxaJ protein